MPDVLVDNGFGQKMKMIDMTGFFAQVMAIGQGQALHGGLATSAPVRTSGRAFTVRPAAVATGTNCDFVTTTVGAQLFKPYSIPEADWVYVGPAGGFTAAGVTQVKAAEAAGIRNYVTGLDIANAGATATEVRILDGAAVIWRTWLAAGQPARDITFPSPLKGTAATALSVEVVTAGAAIYINLQGYAAP